MPNFSPIWFLIGLVVGNVISIVAFCIMLALI